MTNLTVIRFTGSEETEIYLSARHREAARGDLIGLMAVSMYGHNHYAIAVKGEIRRAALTARGLIPELEHELDRILHRRK